MVDVVFSWAYFATGPRHAVRRDCRRCGHCSLQGMASILRIRLRQHRAIVSASRSRLFAPLLQFEKRGIHRVFLRFPNLELRQKSWLRLLAKLCGAALNLLNRSGRHCKTQRRPLWPSLPPSGVVLRAANQDSNDCRWQSYLCFVPRSGKGGDARNFDLLPFNEQHPLSLALLDSSPIGEPRASLPPLGVVLRAANQDSNDCRWQSYLCFVPRQRQRGCSW